MKSHLGPRVLDQFIENTPEHREALVNNDMGLVDDLKDEALGRWMALYLLLKNSDQQYMEVY